MQAIDMKFLRAINGSKREIQDKNRTRNPELKFKNLEHLCLLTIPKVM